MEKKLIIFSLNSNELMKINSKFDLPKFIIKTWYFFRKVFQLFYFII